MALKPLEENLPENHEINVTPFIDVILVLLIIFMVAAPLATVNTPVDLPDSNASHQTPPKKPVYLTVKADHTLLLGDTPVASGQLASVLDHRTGSDHRQRIFLRADKRIAYGELMQVLNTLRSAGYTRVALVGLGAN